MDEPAGAQDGRRGGQSRFSGYSKHIMEMIGGTIVAYYPVRQDIAKHANGFYFAVFRCLLFVTFLAGLALLVLPPYLPRLDRKFRILAHATNILAMLTSVSLLLLLNTSYAWLTILLFPVKAIVGVVFYKEIKTAQAHEVADYEAYQPKLKKIFSLSAPVTVAAFGGMMGTIIGYFKYFPKDVDQGRVKFPEVFIFFAVIIGLLAMLLTTVPPPLRHADVKARLISFLKVLIYALFGLLTSTGLAVTAEFVGWFYLLAFFPIFFAVAAWFSMEFIQEGPTSQDRSSTGHENEPDTPSIAIPIFIFAAMMAVYSLYSSSDDYGFHLKACMFLISLAFMSSLSSMLLAFRPPRAKSLENVAKILIYFTIGGFVPAVISLFFFNIRKG